MFSTGTEGESHIIFKVNTNNKTVDGCSIDYSEDREQEKEIELVEPIHTLVLFLVIIRG